MKTHQNWIQNSNTHSNDNINLENSIKTNCKLIINNIGSSRLSLKVNKNIRVIKKCFKIQNNNFKFLANNQGLYNS